MSALSAPAATVHSARRIPPLPAGFRITRDPATRVLTPNVLFGGVPGRVMRLSEAGRAALAELDAGPVATPASGHLARRLTDAGLAHPSPPAIARAVSLTVLVPVRDRAEELDRCLTAQGSDYPVVVVDDGSADEAAIAAVATRHGARLVRRPVNGGPAAARNTGLTAIDTDLVALLDSDCTPPSGWIEQLAAHLADPLVAVAAPRITAATAGTAGTAGSTIASLAARYAAARGTLDQGGQAALVRPLSPVAFVPSAALVVRRSALESVGAAEGTKAAGDSFDPALRYGEDVDLIWRLVKAGWRVRYDPSVSVNHHEPQRWRTLLGRRYRYGTSAGPLARRHPEAMPPMLISPGPATAVGAALAGWPGLALAGWAATVGHAARALQRADVAPDLALSRATSGVVATWLAAGRYATQLGSPLLLAALVAPPSRGQHSRNVLRRRIGALSLLLAPAVMAWTRSDRSLDPVRFVAAHIVDEVGYGTGVWRGAIGARTARPLLPMTARRAAAGQVRPSVPDLISPTLVSR